MNVPVEPLTDTLAVRECANGVDLYARPYGGRWVFDAHLDPDDLAALVEYAEEASA